MILRQSEDRNIESSFDTSGLPVTTEVLLKRRSLYVLSGPYRYNYTHEIVGHRENSLRDSPNTVLNDMNISRRLSIIFRDQLKQK
jgi:hypothetical protein